VVQVFENQPLGWRWVFQVSGLSLLILLQGGYHQFIWLLFLLVMLATISRQNWLQVVAALICSVSLSAIRTLPATINLGNLQNDFLLGYPSLNSIVEFAVSRYFPYENVLNGDLVNHYGVWETTIYIGLAGLVFLVIFGIIQVFRKRSQSNSYAPLLMPVIGLTLLSLDRVYKYLRLIFPIPIFTGERISSRIFFLAFVILVILAVIEFQKWFDQQPPSAPLFLGSLGLMGIMVNDLWQNSQVWTIKFAGNYFEPVEYISEKWAVTNFIDPNYFFLLWIGAGITILTMGFLILMSRKEKH